MTLRRYANRRDSVEASIVDALRKAGCTVILTDKPTDAICGYRGKTHLAEFKARKGKLTKAQQDFLANWRGSAVYIMRSVDDALAFVKERG